MFKKDRERMKYIEPSVKDGMESKCISSYCYIVWQVKGLVKA